MTAMSTIMPKRVQLRRTKGWRKPEGTVSVARPTRWGNPFKAGDVADPVAEFRSMLLDPNRTEDYPTIAQVQSELRGRDLACWCPLDQPCHADVLLELANGEA
jgi:Domain of unknown function (DUF4326)